MADVNGNNAMRRLGIRRPADVPTPVEVQEEFLKLKDNSYVIHVWTPSLHRVLAKPLLRPRPIVALRSSVDDYMTMRLFNSIELAGPGRCDTDIKAPLPGTSGRAVSLLRTSGALVGWYDSDRYSVQIKCGPGLNLRQVDEVVKAYYWGGK